MTYITTYLTTNEIRTTNGKRVYDRLREMMNVVSYSVEVESRKFYFTNFGNKNIFIAKVWICFFYRYLCRR